MPTPRCGTHFRPLLIMIACLAVMASPQVLVGKEKKEKNKGPVTIEIQAPIDKIKKHLVSQLAAVGFTVESDTPFQIVLSKETEGVTELATRILIGNAYSDKPRIRALFTLARKEETTTVFGRQEVAVRMPLGNTNHVSLDEGKHREDFALFLKSIKVNTEADQSDPAGASEDQRSTP